MRAAILSEPIRMHARTAKVDKTYRTKLLAWRSPPNGDHKCPSHLSHHVRSNVRGTTLDSISDSQFAGSHRGGKCLSREATKHTVLALEWPELVQIGRCKVRWLPYTANKRNLTLFYSKKTNTHNIPNQRTAIRTAGGGRKGGTGRLPVALDPAGDW